MLTLKSIDVNKMNSDEFRVYISTLIGMANRFKKLNVKNSIYLNSDAFSSNPFCRKESFSTLFRASENANEESCKEFIYAHIKEWCFKDLIEESLDAGIIKFYFTFRNMPAGSSIIMCPWVN